MTYIRQTWANGAAGSTPISATRLNHIEDGIEAIDVAAAFAPVEEDAVVYVSKGSGASDLNDGFSAGKAKVTLDAALAALPISGLPGGGGKVKMLFGDFTLTTTATYTGDRLIIEGLGYGLTRIIAPDNALALDVGQAGVIGREFRVSGVTFYRPTAGGAGLLRVRKMDQSRVSDCGFAGGTVNIEMTGCIASVVERCGINSFTQDGLAIDNSDQVIITSNTWETNFGGQNHVKLNSGNKAISISDNIFSTALRAVYVDGGPSDDCSITDNVVENCSNGFIIGGLTTPSSSRWTITGNNLRGINAASSVGIRVYGSNHTIVGNNVSQYTASIDETGAATSNHLVVGNKTDVAVNITSTGSTLGLNGVGDILLSATARLSTLGSAYYGTDINPVAGAIKLQPFISTNRTAIQVGNGSAWQSVIDFLDARRLAFFGATPVVQPAANPDTSGATLAELETEVNQLKAALRALGLIAT
jgi:hypothetical protein